MATEKKAKVVDGVDPEDIFFYKTFIKNRKDLSEEDRRGWAQWAKEHGVDDDEPKKKK